MVLSARSDLVPIDPNQIKGLVELLRLVQNFQVSIVTLLVYDTIITLDKEVRETNDRARMLTPPIVQAKYFWKLPRRPVDFIYFINQYTRVFGVVVSLFQVSFSATVSLCNFSIWTMNIANWITVISINYILMIHVLALYSQEKTLSICLKTLLALEAAFKMGMLVYLQISDHITVGIFSDISICGEPGIPPWQLEMIDWLIPLLYGTLLMILALYKAAEYWRMSNGFKGFTLVRVLIEDQIVYFLLAISCSVFAILEFRVELSNGFLAVVLNQLGNPAILSLLGSRMLFNLKEAGERGQNEGTSYRTSSGTISDMDFAEPVNPQRENGTEHSGSEQMA